MIYNSWKTLCSLYSLRDNYGCWITRGFRFRSLNCIILNGLVWLLSAAMAVFHHQLQRWMIIYTITENLIMECHQSHLISILCRMQTSPPLFHFIPLVSNQPFFIAYLPIDNCWHVYLQSSGNSPVSCLFQWCNIIVLCHVPFWWGYHLFSRFVSVMICIYQ